MIEPGPEFGQLFRTFEHTAFRLETRDNYKSANETAALAQFVAGEPVDLSWFQNWLSMIREATAAGIRPIKIHHARHTTATLLKKLGVPDRDIQTILGHSHISVTQEICQHADLEDRRAALSLLFDALNLGGDRMYCRQSGRQTPVTHFSININERSALA